MTASADGIASSVGFYEPVSAEPYIVGDIGMALTDLRPSGFVRVYGDLWQAEAASDAYISEGSAVCVRDIRGLLLIVEALPQADAVAARQSSFPASRV